ncbi:exosome complex component MTR3-like [Bradysia coprophila]|uniref:exosome complex component MTR3-like n=1 Tax=Bradysia coprophila TaxID=38358 RepID=UPI00187DBEC9|nr:exosome complex component MTR3-like [Bradysia coprophila]
MPYDNKRINGPDSSISYQYHSKANLKTYEDKLKELFQQENELRVDGRRNTEARKMFLKSGVISQAKGSAYIELGNTKVIVAVYDPREIPKQNKYSALGELFCDFKFSSFASKKRRSPQTDSEEQSLALSMKRSLMPVVCRHEFPNFQVDIFANVIQDDGSVLGAAITCAGLALADAGIPMYDIITSTTVGIIDNKIILDPNAAEEDVCNNGFGDQEHGIIVMSRLSTHDQISELWQSGFIHLDTLQSANKLLLETTQEIVPIIKKILVKKIVKSIKETERNDESAK